MKTAPVNIFQRLMRNWESVHPYNAAQVLEVAGNLNSPATRQQWSRAWNRALISTGLGLLHATNHRYGFTPLSTTGGTVEPRHLDQPWGAHVSAEINRAFEDGDGFPLRPFLASVDGDRFAVGLVYRHWIADSVSIRMLLREWFLCVVDPAKVRHKPFRFASRGYWNTVGPGRSGCGIVESVSDSIRRQTRLRRAQKISSANLTDHRTAFIPLDTPPALVPALRRFARERGVTLNHVFVAALAETCWKHVPLQPRPSRREVAVGSIADLRPSAAEDLTDVFGLFLGFTSAVCQPHELADFDRLLAVVSSQTRKQKIAGIAACSLMWMSAAAMVARFSKPGELYHFYRKDLPLAGGISNVDLNRTWPAEYWQKPLLRYVRVSPSGPMTPVVLTTTTLGDRLDVGLTYRCGLIGAELASRIGDAFLKRLGRCAI